MTESGKTEQQAEKPDVHSFGERLYAARISQGLSIAEVAKAVNLTVDVIEAIERSDVAHLPQPAFVQGYIRVYARQIGVPEDVVLEEYSRAVPHARETVLRPRSTLHNEAHSGSPFVKIVSIFLLIAVVLAAAYGMFTYYSEMADTMAPEIGDVGSDVLEIPYQEYPMAESVTSTAGSEEFEVYNVETVIAEPEPEEVTAEPELTETQDSDTAAKKVEQDTARVAVNETQQATPGEDVLVFSAEKPSWVEVVDANGVRLQYDLVQNGRTVTLKGTGPFDIFLGNAPAMAVWINDIKIDMTKYVRSNNIAHFKVSVSGSQVIFH